MWLKVKGGSRRTCPQLSGLTRDFVVAGLVELPHVELQSNDSKHEDGHEEQQADLQQGNHGLHDGLEHHLQAWRAITHTVQMWREKITVIANQTDPPTAANQEVQLSQE